MNTDDVFDVSSAQYVDVEVEKISLVEDGQTLFCSKKLGCVTVYLRGIWASLSVRPKAHLRVIAPLKLTDMVVSILLHRLFFVVFLVQFSIFL